MEAEGAEGAPGGTEAALSCFSFNQDCTSLAIGTKAGYKLFSLSSVEQLDHVHGSNDTPDVYIVERLFSSSLVVVVSHTKPRQMNVYHFKKGTEICNYSYSGNILSIRLNRQRLLVCLEESIYIHNIKDMKLLKTILDIPANPTGSCSGDAFGSGDSLNSPLSQTPVFIETHVVKILYLNALGILPHLPCSNPLVNKNGLGLIQWFDCVFTLPNIVEAS